MWQRREGLERGRKDLGEEGRPGRGGKDLGKEGRTWERRTGSGRGKKDPGEDLQQHLGGFSLLILTQTTERWIRSTRGRGKSTLNSCHSQGRAGINALIPAGRGLCTHTGVSVPPLRSCWPEITSPFFFYFFPFSSLNLKQIPAWLSSSVRGAVIGVKRSWRRAGIVTKGE